jgi:hypothetical protein
VGSHVEETCSHWDSGVMPTEWAVTMYGGAVAGSSDKPAPLQHPRWTQSTRHVGLLHWRGCHFCKALGEMALLSSVL